jgi:DNA-binding CsgD family transcriptional regulator/catechol 2,3-dioxygenase-like lactoylglutathione lyase family enzyme
MIWLRRRGRPPYPDLLTPAEWRVTDAVRHGLSNPVLAARQGVSAEAVKYHLANIFRKLGLANRGQLRHWPGISRNSLLARKDSAMETIAFGPVGQIARSVKNIQQATDFYANKMGLKHLYTYGTLAFFDCGNLRLFLSEGDSRASESILYFRVPDVRPAAALLAERGVTFLNAPHMVHKHDDGTEEWMAFFEDNEGRPLALMAQIKG